MPARSAEASHFIPQSLLSSHQEKQVLMAVPQIQNPNENETKRLSLLAASGLLQYQHLPEFDEAVKTAAKFLEVPICIISIPDRHYQWVKASLGWSQLAIFDDTPQPKKIPHKDAFCSRVVASEQVLALRDTAADSTFTNSKFLQKWGIRAYLGVPLFTHYGVEGNQVKSERICIGTLAVMDLAPRSFSEKDIQFLELVASNAMKDLETQRLHSIQPTTDRFLHQELITDLLNELRNPLSSIMGMTSVLNSEIYGALKTKQKEYLDTIYSSGQYLLALVEEVLELRQLDSGFSQIQTTPVDIEMLCQQVVKNLEPLAARNRQQLQLTVEPGDRIWFLDRTKVRQILYHLTLSVIKAAEAACTVRLHVSRKDEHLNIAVWFSHLWLGDGIPAPENYPCHLPVPKTQPATEPPKSRKRQRHAADDGVANLVAPQVVAMEQLLEQMQLEANQENNRDLLELWLSCQLTSMHGGQIWVKGNPELGYRYIVSFSNVQPQKEDS
ncbi:GAF domain-containing sensor histidine kinase [Geitlerinema sp. PCC 9228]|uniref:GAF domain-containing sensor histidine kinase n=1 Tax=Geitlerinema sp. PCC 9228 TaxID=111611 RepID=UPI001114C6EC|nr:GAF domain-containing sensor histidine kinase [Geitlerinema sp. PCC 9228]